MAKSKTYVVAPGVGVLQGVIMKPASGENGRPVPLPVTYNAGDDIVLEETEAAPLLAVGKILEKPKNAPAPAPVPVKPPPTTATVTQDTSKAGGATVTEVAKVESKTDAPLGDDETDD